MKMHIVYICIPSYENENDISHICCLGHDDSVASSSGSYKAMLPKLDNKIKNNRVDNAGTRKEKPYHCIESFVN